MSVFVPGVIGSEQPLRQGVESLLSDNPAAFNARISELDNSLAEDDRSVTFSTEVEYKLIPNPTCNPGGVVPHKEEAYLEVLEELAGARARQLPESPKGDVCWPEECPGPVLKNSYKFLTYNYSQAGSKISEVKPAPADALEAIERYWRTIGAIGSVAARHNCIGLILGTDVNVCIVDQLSDGSKNFLRFSGEPGRQAVGAIQYALQALRPLQIDAGLETGMVVHEAFPTKDAMTMVHERRLEIKHPLVGAVDPRVDVLGVLGALNMLRNGSIPERALRASKFCNKISILSRDLTTTFAHLVVSDLDGSLRMPTELSSCARGPGVKWKWSEFVEEMTSGATTDYLKDNGAALRQIITGVRVGKEAEMEVDPTGPYAVRLREYFDGTAVIPERRCRTTPYIYDDSPKLHRSRRQHVAKSSTVRSVLGGALASVTPGTQSIARRRRLIKNEMIVAKDDEAS